jgi:hypothetical protein
MKYRGRSMPQLILAVAFLDVSWVITYGEAVSVLTTKAGKNMMEVFSDQAINRI